MLSFNTLYRGEYLYITYILVRLIITENKIKRHFNNESTTINQTFFFNIFQKGSSNSAFQLRNTRRAEISRASITSTRFPKFAFPRT